MAGYGNEEIQRSVYAGGFDRYLAWQDLKDHMKGAGEVEFTEMLYSEWGEPRGAAFVRYKTEAEAKQAIAMLNGSTLGDKQIKVGEWTGAKPNPNSTGKQLFEMWSWMGHNKRRRVETDPVKAELINRVKTYQKASQAQKDIWYSFCGEIKDPARHDVAKLQMFCTTYSVP
eukprot:TRINITY_DN107161_c0_g1_i1.p1 TRINITY_DN107161_c0_g1~~TRINITY_DN107161_c0_g1_i1.p1  ORF type:complete len:171 (+),score=39.92 TRINITY_DN107161_c0_g1_i1:65-577(+)